jgi:hypothetical protein
MICRRHKACVQCVAYGTGELKGNCEECKIGDYISVEDTLPGKNNTAMFYLLKNEVQKSNAIFFIN